MFWGFGHGLLFFTPFLLLGRLFWLVILGLLIWGLIRWLSSRNRQVFSYNPRVPPVQPSALEILRQRYARGEIDTATFDRMREQLERSGGPGPQ